MGEVLVFTEEHAAGAATLYFRAMRGRTQLPGPAIIQYFGDILLRNPWAASDIPSLVYVEKGKVIGTLGVIPRQMQLGERALRAAVSTQFMVDPDHRKSPAALLLLRRFLSGPQDISWTDGASDTVHPLWTACGGQVARLYSFQWMRLLRPFGFAQNLAARRTPAWVSALGRLAADPADAVAGWLAGSNLRPPAPPFPAKLVSTEDLFACIQQTGWRERLSPVYEAASFSWMLDEAAKATNGELRRLIVPAKDGSIAGWAVYWAKPGGTAYLLQIGTRRRDLFTVTLDAVFNDAWQQGCSIIKGYGMPAYHTQLTERACIFRHPGACTLVHSRDSNIVNIVLAGEAALTRLDGECWLRFASENWK